MCSRINITFDHLQYIILFAFWSDKYCAKGRLYNSAMPNAALTHTSHTAPLSKWQNSNGNGQHTHTQQQQRPNRKYSNNNNRPKTFKHQMDQNDLLLFSSATHNMPGGAWPIQYSNRFTVAVHNVFLSLAQQTHKWKCSLLFIFIIILFFWSGVCLTLLSRSPHIGEKSTPATNTRYNIAQAEHSECSKHGHWRHGQPNRVHSTFTGPITMFAVAKIRSIGCYVLPWVHVGLGRCAQPKQQPHEEK